MAAVLRRTRQHGRALGRAQHALQVRGLRRKLHRQAAEQRIVRGIGMQLDRDGAHLAPRRVVADLAAQCMRQQLVAVADAEQRRARMRGIAQPLRAALAPVAALGDHRSRTGDQHAGKSPGIGQRFAGLDIDDPRGIGGQSRGDPDPVREAPVPAHRGHRLSGFEDEERLGKRARERRVQVRATCSAIGAWKPWVWAAARDRERILARFSAPTHGSGHACRSPSRIVRNRSRSSR